MWILRTLGERENFHQENLHQLRLIKFLPIGQGEAWNKQAKELRSLANSFFQVSTDASPLPECIDFHSVESPSKSGERARLNLYQWPSYFVGELFCMGRNNVEILKMGEIWGQMEYFA